jgi:hypothetical protein
MTEGYCKQETESVVVCSSETSAEFFRTTRCYIPDYSIFRSHRCVYLKWNLQKSVFILMLVNSEHRESVVQLSAHTFLD